MNSWYSENWPLFHIYFTHYAVRNSFETKYFNVHVKLYTSMAENVSIYIVRL